MWAKIAAADSGRTNQKAGCLTQAAEARTNQRSLELSDPCKSRSPWPMSHIPLKKPLWAKLVRNKILVSQSVFPFTTYPHLSQSPHIN